MCEYASSQQREINRTLLPQIQQRMKPGYEAAVNTERGGGRFQRIKDAVGGHSRSAMEAMFRQATDEVLLAVSRLISELHERTSAVYDAVLTKLQQVFSVCWERAGANPAEREAIRRARDEAVHTMLPLRQRLDVAMVQAGVARELPDVEMVDVYNRPGPDERMAAAAAAGEIYDLTGETDGSGDEAGGEDGNGISAITPVRVPVKEGE